MRLSQLVAHRGFSRLYPENSRRSVREALKLGLSYAEIDVQLSSDHVPVVIHDATLRRTGAARADVRRLPWASLKRCPIGEPGRFGAKFGGERLSSLRALAAEFARFKKGRLFVELKEESLKPFGRLEMLAAVHEALLPIRRRSILISFDVEVLLLARAVTSYPLGLVIRRWSDLKSPSMRRLAPEFVFSGTPMLPKNGSLGIKGCRHCVYEVPDKDEGRELLRRGVDLIETFAVDNYL
jgi:glycerophosphoryl diester phosphodiesterase